eukprot:1518192-Rhodomonas_salina.2
MQAGQLSPLLSDIKRNSSARTSVLVLSFAAYLPTCWLCDLRYCPIPVTDEAKNGGALLLYYQTKWYHPACIFASFKRVRALTKTITSTADLQVRFLNPKP